MTPQPFVDQEHAWTPCAYCGELCYPGITHTCATDDAGADDRVVIACLVLIAVALVVLAAGWWTPEWPHR